MPRLLLMMLLGFGFAASGCALSGPAAIRNGRQVYNDAIVGTNNEQVLAMIVRMRYLEPSGLLAVSSVTANVRIQANTAAQFGIGPDSSFEGNLVPLGAGVVYEENPTISYTPVAGPQYLRQLLSPIPLDMTVLVLGATRHSPQVTLLIIRSINGIQNPHFTTAPSEQPDPRFARIAELLAALDRRGSLTWAQEDEEKPSFALLLNGEGAEYEQEVSELYRLLGLRVPPSLEGLHSLPVFLGVGKRPQDAIELTTRSVYDLFEIAASSVDVPAEHVESGLAHPRPAVGPAGAGMRVGRSSRRPAQAMVAVQHHGWWYSIDGTDAPSKNAFPAS